MLLKDKLKDKRLILASRSPRRSELLKGAGFDFVVAEYDVDEVFSADMPAESVPQYLARLKSDAYSEPLAEKDIVITADTVVILDGQIMGKPTGREQAIDMIGRLSGRQHTVVTGVCLRNLAGSRSFSSSSRVIFRELTAEEIEYYVDTFRPCDKAGAYGIQEWIGYVGIKGVEGSFYNVIGLPVQTLYVELERLLDNISSVR